MQIIVDNREQTPLDFTPYPCTVEAAPHSVLQSMTAYTVRYGVNWIWAGNPAGAGYFTYWTLQKYLAEAQKRFRLIAKAEACQTAETS